jgi:hypothetical protein
MSNKLEAIRRGFGEKREFTPARVVSQSLVHRVGSSIF